MCIDNSAENDDDEFDPLDDDFVLDQDGELIVEPEDFSDHISANQMDKIMGNQD